MGKLEVQESWWRKSQAKGRRSAFVPAQTGSPGAHILHYPAFCFIRGSTGLDEARPHGGGQSAFFSLLIAMLISSRNTQNNV